MVLAAAFLRRGRRQRNKSSPLSLSLCLSLGFTISCGRSSLGMGRAGGGGREEGGGDDGGGVGRPLGFVRRVVWLVPVPPPTDRFSHLLQPRMTFGFSDTPRILHMASSSSAFSPSSSPLRRNSSACLIFPYFPRPSPLHGRRGRKAHPPGSPNWVHSVHPHHRRLLRSQ